MKRRALLATLLTITVSLVCSCGEKKSDQREPSTRNQTVPPDEGGGVRPPASLDITPRATNKVLLMLDSRYEPFRLVQMKLLARLALTRAGMKFEVWDAAGSAATQRKQIVEKADGANFLLVFPVDLTEISEVLKVVKSHGAKVILFDAEAPADVTSTSIFGDEEKVGQLAGDYVISALRQHAKDEHYESVLGRVVYLQDEGGGPALQKRHDSFLKALATEPGITLVHEAPVDASGTQAAPRIAEAFRLQKDFDVIFADTDLIAEAASNAVSAAQPAARENMLIVGADGATGKGGGIDLTIASKIDATIMRPPLVDLAWVIVKKSLDDSTFTPKRRYDQEPRLITPQTAMDIAREGLPVPEVK